MRVARRRIPTKNQNPVSKHPRYEAYFDLLSFTETSLNKIRLELLEQEAEADRRLGSTPPMGAEAGMTRMEMIVAGLELEEAQ